MGLNNHSAPGSNAGFIYQFERALLWLAHSPAGALVGIETDDDVAVRTSGGGAVLEQDKHTITEDRQPFSDRSHDLWNTLCIWLEAVDDGEVLIASSQFWMVTNKRLPECLAKQIGRAKTSDEIATCVRALESIGKAPSATIKDQALRVLHPSSRANLVKLVECCHLADAGQGSGGRELRDQTIAKLQLPQWCAAMADAILDELHGWLERTVMTSWGQRKPAWIARDHFVNQLHAILARLARQIKRERSEHLIPVSDEKVGQNRGRPFVKQLFMVSDDDSSIDTAIREFIRCNIEKNRLSEEGDITDDDWLGFEGALVARWGKIRARNIRLCGDKLERDVGFQILAETTEGHQEVLAGNPTEQAYLTSGSYHRLADALTVGWHPRYKELMNPNS